MRFAVFHPGFETLGGAELLAAAEARFYQDRGLAPTLVTLAYDRARWASRLEGIPVELVRKRSWTDLFNAWDRMGKLRSRGRRAAEVLAGFDLVVAHNFPASAMLGAADIQARKVWQCNEPPRGIHLALANPTLDARSRAVQGEPLEAATREYRRSLALHQRKLEKDSSARARRDYDLAAVERMDLIYAISEFSRENARRIYGRCEAEVVSPIVRFPEGGRTRPGLDRTVRRVLVHSRLEVLKNVDTVIRGFARFAQASPVPCELHLVGEGPRKEDLQRLAQELCPGTATFHGFLSNEDLRAVYEACDAFVLLTLDEPFGMVYPEAAAKGLLMVGPDHGGPLEILDGGRLGWCIDPFDPEALRQALDEIWSLSDAEADRRRAEADAACRSRYSLEALAPRLLRVVGAA